jgi:hypothetical protein
MALDDSDKVLEVSLSLDKIRDLELDTPFLSLMRRSRLAQDVSSDIYDEFGSQVAKAKEGEVEVDSRNA